MHHIDTIDETLLEPLNEDQRKAAREILDFVQDPERRMHTLQGHAGTGKTFLVNVVREILLDNRIPVHLVATTNKAATLLQGSETTIHKLLGLIPQGDESSGRTVLVASTKGPQLKARSVVMVDEASMVDRELINRALDITKAYQAKILFIGDAYQLPPVGYKVSPVFEIPGKSALTQMMRQALDNPILAYAEQFRQAVDNGVFPKLQTITNPDTEAGIQLCNAGEFQDKLEQHFGSPEYAENPNHCRFVSWTNKRSRAVAQQMRVMLNPEAETKRFLKGEIMTNVSAVKTASGEILQTDELVKLRSIEESSIFIGGYDIAGHKVFATSLDGKLGYDVFVPYDFDKVGALLSELSKKASDLQKEYNQLRTKKTEAECRDVDRKRRRAWVEFFTAKERFAELRSVHGSTVHKAQGSTYDVIFIDVSDIGRNTKADEVAKLLYVALTRPRTTAYIYGELPERFFK